jgi:signal transduction histidine kinase
LSPHFRELTTIIVEESDRLTTLVNEAVRMSQIDAGKFRIERTLIDPDELVRAVLNTFTSRVEERKLTLHSDGNLPQVPVDRELLELALRQLIDNALKYSPEGSPVDVFTGVENGRVTIRIRDEGPGIPERERDRVFDRFYRQGSAKSRVSGTGMGLYIAREIVRAHGGDVWIEANQVAVALPILNEGQSFGQSEPKT